MHLGHKMKKHNLSFGNFNEIEPNVLEIIAHEGAVITKSNIIQLEEYLYEKYPTKFSLLINRVFSYSHEFGSMEQMSKVKNLAALAIVVQNPSKAEAAKIHKLFVKNVKVFFKKSEAIKWLMKMMEQE